MLLVETIRHHCNFGIFCLVFPTLFSVVKGIQICRIWKTQKSERFLPVVLYNIQNACTDTEMSFDKITSIFSSLEKEKNDMAISDHSYT